jgi:phage/plasmid-like protein (TIGR03299 family)
MSHEMYEHDNAVYVSEPAWHGLGVVVEHAPTLSEALRLAEMDFEVEISKPLYANYSGGATENSKFHATVRTDTNEVLGVVSENYKVIQNRELFELADALGNEAKVETAGTLKNGAQSYLLLRTDEFEASKGDEICEYFALLNSHDRSLSLSGLPTSIRIVCSNTLNWALTQNNRNMICITHRGDMDEKISYLRDAIGEWKNYRTDFRSAVQTLARKSWSQEEIRTFWLDVYSLIEADIPKNPKTDEEQKVYTKAVVTMDTWAETFDRESQELGASAWLAANAVTNWLQHKTGTRGRKTSEESRTANKLLGPAAQKTTKVMKMALDLV